MWIIPAIDIIDGQCVRLTKGNYQTKKVYDTNPLDVAKAFEDTGITHLHLVDLDGAKAGKIINFRVLEGIASNTSLSIDFAGGIRSDDDIIAAFNAGAKQITCGSIAVRNPPLFLSWLERFGAGKMILGADVKDNRIAISGWEETSEMMIHEFIKEYHSKGVQWVTCTDINKDGMMQGPAFELYKSLLEGFPELKLIASGGVRSIEDIRSLEQVGVSGVIIGKAVYEGLISLEELSALC